MIVRFRPLELWPYPDSYPRRSRWTFKAGWQNTLDLLRRELRYLDGANIILGAGFQETDLRQDGMPYADARVPEHPGIELSFDSPHGRLVYATDACEWWQHNVRAIALGLEALRAVDRHGITRKGEQYAGWRQLGSGGGSMGVEEASAMIGERSIARALKDTHPDHGGDPDEFQRVLEAKRVLEAAR